MEQANFSSYSAGSLDTNRPDDEAAVVAGGQDLASTPVVDASQTHIPDATGELELAVMQVNYTIESEGSAEYPIIHIFGRTADSETEHVTVIGVEPYFYVPTAEITENPVEQHDAIIDARETDPDGNNFKGIRGEKLTKLVARTPRDVGQVRNEFETTYEADILFPNRFLIDNGIRNGIRVEERRLESGIIQVTPSQLEPVEVDAKPQVLTLDIEVDDRRGFPEDGEEPIVCLTSHDSASDAYIAWLFDAPDGTETLSADAAPAIEFLDENAQLETRVFDAEEAMLKSFISYIHDASPDVLTGWNVEDFDMPYLLDRLTELGIDENQFSRIGEVWRSSGGWGGPNVKGYVVFDLLNAYQRTQISELDSYRLDDVAEMELGVGKERYTGDIGDLWEEDPLRLLEYNIRDVELCVEIDRKQDIIDFWDEVRKFVGCKLEDAPTPGDAVDMYVLHKAFGKFALPTKGQQEGEEFEGGAVFDPITGVKEMVCVLDLASLYPMAMMTMNASPETKVDPDSYEGETYVAPNGQHFREEPDGIMREMIAELLGERDEKKTRRDEYEPGTVEYERFDQQQAAVKVIMNSLYGVSGWERFRLYDKESAAAITATGREVIKFTEQAANDLDKDVIYGDTDSVMLELGGSVSKEEAISQAFEIESYINEQYDSFAKERLDADTHWFEIEFEKLYRRFFQSGRKKRYAGHIIWKEGVDVDDIDITGFEYKRSDIASITKRVQKEVLEKIVTGEQGIEVLKDDLVNYLNGIIEEFLGGDVDIDDIGIPGGIGKRLDNYDTDTAQVRGAKYANLLLGTNFNRGSKPKRYYLEKVHPEFFRKAEEANDDLVSDPVYLEFKRDPDVICIEFAEQLPSEFFIDYEKMLDKTLKGPISRILEALDITWEEVKTGQEQTGLGQYW